jgi:hypothetical protein
MKLNYINIFSWKKPELSEFYLATLFAYFLSQIAGNFVAGATVWLVSGLQSIFQASVRDDEVWYFLILVCFFATILIRKYLIQPLGLKIDKQATSTGELMLTFFAVFGFFIYIINFLFRQAMPRYWGPFIARVLGGYESTFGAGQANLSDRNFWSIMPWFWILFPLIIFYLPVLRGASAPSKKE